MLLGVGNIEQNGNITIGGGVTNIFTLSDVFYFNPFYNDGDGCMMIFMSNSLINATLNGKKYATRYFMLTFRSNPDVIKEYCKRESELYNRNNNIYGASGAYKNYSKIFLVSDTCLYPIIQGNGPITGRISSDKIQFSDNIRFIFSKVTNKIFSCFYSLTNDISKYIYGQSQTNTTNNILYFDRQVNSTNKTNQNTAQQNQGDIQKQDDNKLTGHYDVRYYEPIDEIPQEEREIIQNNGLVKNHNEYVKYRSQRNTKVNGWRLFNVYTKQYTPEEIEQVINEINNSDYKGDIISKLLDALNKRLVQAQKNEKQTSAVIK